MREQLKPEDTFGGLRINAQTIAILRKKFPPVSVSPASTSAEMFFSGGEQRVLGYLEELSNGGKKL